MKVPERKPVPALGEAPQGASGQSKRGLGASTRLAQLVSKSARVQAQGALSEQVNRSAAPSQGKDAAHQELAILNAAMANQEDEQKKPF